MGFQTTITILNDALHEIDADPKGWWEKTSQLIQGHSGLANPKQYGFGSHSNGFTIAGVHHADVTSIIAVGANHCSVLGYQSRQGHHTKELQLEILKKLAAEQGYELVKKGDK